MNPSAPVAPDRPPGSAAAGESRWRPGTRARLLGWYIVLMALTLFVGLLVLRTILLNDLDSEVDAQLRQEVAELEQLAGGNNPETGEPFGTDLDAIFDTFLRRNIPSEGEAVFTLINGTPHSSSVTPLQLLNDPAIVERWSAIDEPTEDEIDTDEGRVRYLAVPVEGGTNTGTFVVAMFLESRVDAINTIFRTGALVFGSAFLLASGIAWFTAGRVLHPIRDLTSAARSISESNWSRRIEVEGDDEIAQLGHTFNEMLDRLESAFDAQRRLVDDAGHELRTPITIIRGHLELLALEADAEERAETQHLVMDELDRMARIVEDLLLLAKAEQADFLHLQPVDVDELIEEIAAKAAPFGDRAWTIEANAPAVIVADRQRLTQAMMNLCRNAVEHTPPGTPVWIGSRVAGDYVSLWVSDAGQGIAEEDRDRIFERFRRGGSERRTEGAGLGLSIVAAIAEAHGGFVRLQSVPGQGATLTLILPVDPRAAASHEEPQT